MFGVRCLMGRICALLLLCFPWSSIEANDFTPLPWNESHSKAREMLQQMTDAEKVSLMQGRGWYLYFSKKWWYVGNTPPIPRLGIPSLNMQDAASGFRPLENEIIGTVTCWPSLLALAATWDEDLAYKFGVALGREFSGKGANALLGPSVEVHRVARGGRNFEYLSGEDPYLGARLVPPYVKGVQSQGVFTVLKHYQLNQQETHRTTQSSSVDEKTRWELYYPPFQAAIDAGTSAVMCSYNLIDNVHACSNSLTLHDHLKGRMGFQGFVQSDWWATHATTVKEGLDQSMPGTHRYYSPKNLLCAPGQLLMDTTPWVFWPVILLVFLSCMSCAYVVRGIRRSRRGPGIAEDGQVVTDSTREVELAVSPRSSDIGFIGSFIPRSTSQLSIMLLGKRVDCCTGCLLFTFVLIIVSSLGFAIWFPAMEIYRCEAPGSEAIDDSVERILSVMYRMDLFSSTKCAPPDCKEWLMKNVTNADHADLAKTIARESIVLLKNYENVLPISKSRVKKLAIVGSAAAAPVTNVSVASLIEHGLPRVIWTLAIVLVLILIGVAVIIWARRNRGSSRSKVSLIVASIVIFLLVIAGMVAIRQEVLDVGHMWGYGDFYAGGGSGRVTPLHVSTPLQGISDRAAKAGISVMSEGSNDQNACLTVAMQADLTIVVAGTSSGEDTDRINLNLDDDADDLIAALASKDGVKVVVLVQIPGTVLMPWHKSVHGIAAMFLGGQETGAAWADVIFGDMSPTGRLPLAIPASEADTIPPNDNLEIVYTEGLATSYRNKNFNYIFPFGHGLSYSSFTYSDLGSNACEVASEKATCVSITVKNTGDVRARTTVQLYLEFPSEAKQPAPILKGFNKTKALDKGQSTTVVFPLTEQHIRYYESGEWKFAEHGTVHIGESSSNIKESKDVTFQGNSKNALSPIEHAGIDLFEVV